VSEARDPAIHRNAARVLPVDANGRVLLLHARDPGRPRTPFWFTVGGAIELSETQQQGAARELREETGIVVAPRALGSPFSEDTVRFSWGGRDRVQDQVYFAIAARHHAVSFDGHDRWEQDSIIGYRWWRPDELQACGAATTPGLFGLMRAAIRHLDRHRAR
jgi:8-oxo-dGTP pyrophosphatase MutT (NUDIX family)